MSSGTLTARSRARGVPLFAISTLVAAALLGPIVLVVLQARQSRSDEIHRVIFRSLTVELLGHTAVLALLVGGACAVIGTAAAWCVERTTVPLRRLWAVIVVLPVAIPDFVVGFAWHSVAEPARGLRGAVLVMTLALYPLVYLPVAAALRRSDPALEEASRALGHGPWSTFVRVTLRQVRPALLGGTLIVVLAMLSEYGAFEIVGYRTFTTEIFAERKIDVAAAAATSVILVLVGIVVLAGEALASRQGGGVGQPRPSARPPMRHVLGRSRGPAFLGMAALAGAGVGVPIGTLIYWMSVSQHTTLPHTTSLLAATAHTAGYSAAAAALATVLALPIAVLALRRGGWAAMVLERSTYLARSVPGLVVAIALAFFALRWVPSLYQSGTLLVIAYAIIFFPLALVCVRASVAQAPPLLEDVGRSLGQRPLAVLRRVTLPLVAPGLAAGFSLVFLSAVTELTATLALRPTGVDTLATEFWKFQSVTSYGAAAPYAAVIVAVAALPSVLLSRWFDRRPGAAVVVAT